MIQYLVCWLFSIVVWWMKILELWKYTYEIIVLILDYRQVMCVICSVSIIQASAFGLRWLANWVHSCQFVTSEFFDASVAIEMHVNFSDPRCWDIFELVASYSWFQMLYFLEADITKLLDFGTLILFVYGCGLLFHLVMLWRMGFT